MNVDTPEAKALKEKVATANRILAYAGLATGATAYLGHASARIPNTDYIVIGHEGSELAELEQINAAVTAGMENSVEE